MSIEALRKALKEAVQQSVASLIEDIMRDLYEYTPKLTTYHANSWALDIYGQNVVGFGSYENSLSALKANKKLQDIKIYNHARVIHGLNEGLISKKSFPHFVEFAILKNSNQG